MIDIAVQIIARPSLSLYGVPEPRRELRSDAWLDFLAAYRAGDPWLALIGGRRGALPNIKVPTPEDLAREAKGGLAAPRTYVGIIYQGKLRASMPASDVIRSVDGAFLVLDQWAAFAPITMRQEVHFFQGYLEPQWKPVDLVPSARWAEDGLAPEVAAQARAVLAAAAAPRANMAPPLPITPAPAAPAREERIIFGEAQGRSVPFRIEGGSADGAVGRLCGVQTEKTKPCIVCGKPGARLCDWPLGKKKTCSAALCAEHTVKEGEDKDFCPKHANERAAVETKKMPTNKAGGSSDGGGQLGLF